MHEVTLNAVVAERTLENGIEINVTDPGRMRESIQRTVHAPAIELQSLGWAAKTEMLPDGVKMIVTRMDRNSKRYFGEVPGRLRRATLYPAKPRVRDRSFDTSCGLSSPSGGFATIPMGWRLRPSCKWRWRGPAPVGFNVPL
jgi:hypothetical protein